MPSILNPGALQPNQGGLFGSYSVPAGGIFSALKDVAGYLGGGGSTDNFAQYNAQNQQAQMRQQLLQGLTSEDPAMRSQAYSTAALLGIDTKPIQQQMAAQALPKLLQSMQPSTQTVSAMPAPLPMGPQFAPQTMDYQKPGANLSDALAQSGSPELQAQYAPQLIQSQITQQAEANKPYDLSPGQHRFVGGQDIASLPEKPTPNQPFNPDGSPNLAFQKYEQGKIKDQQAPAWANVELARQRLSGNIPNEDTLHDMAVRYVHGDKTAFGAMGRNPAAQTAAQNMISQVGREMGLKPEQVSQNQQTFQAGTRAVQAFDTGKQGDTTRSLNVSVAHLNTLKDLGTALQNGDITLINAAKQKFAEAFGVPAPTNFDAARAIVADEVAKGVIGGQTAQADREALAASLKRERSPQAINGAISTFQNLLAGQLHGLRQQYKSSTGRDDFNDKLFPETISVLETAPRKKVAAPVSPAALPRLPAAQKIRIFNPATGKLE